MKHTNVILFFDLVRRLNEIAHAEDLCVSVFGTYTSSFTAYLLGATRINPIQPHTRCPVCKSVRLHPEALDGFDLEPESCECGAQMIGDGHDIPMKSNTQISRTKALSMEVRTPESLLPVLGKEIQAYFRDAFRVVPIKRDASVLRYSLFPLGKPTPGYNASGMVEISMEEWHQLYRDVDSVLLVPGPGGSGRGEPHFTECSAHPRYQDTPKTSGFPHSGETV